MTPIHFGLSRNFIGRREREREGERGRNEMSRATAAAIEIAQIVKHSLICFSNMSLAAAAAAFSAIDSTGPWAAV